MELPDKQRTLCLLQIKVLVTCWLRKKKKRNIQSSNENALNFFI